MKKVALILTAVAAAVLAISGAALAAPGSAPDPGTVQADGRISTILAVGGRIYLGGAFTHVTDTDGTVLARNNLAAVDADTGRVTGWNPDANGQVFALAASADGSRVYAGGAFTNINGATRNRLVALDAATGATDSQFRISLGSTVRAIAVQGNRVYIGGDFTTVKGLSRPRLALLDATTGSLDPNWAPYADGRVRALAFSPDGARLYAGGEFTAVNGRSGSYLAGLDAANAGATVWQPLVYPNGRVYSLAVSGARVYSGEGGPGGAVAAYDAGTGALAWSRRGDGDVQAVTVLDGKAYIGGHFLRFGGQDRRLFAAVDATTGVLEAWNPAGANTGTGLGVWALTTDPLGTRIYAGGDFVRVSGTAYEHYAQFSSTG